MTAGKEMGPLVKKDLPYVSNFTWHFSKSLFWDGFRLITSAWSVCRKDPTDEDAAFSSRVVAIVLALAIPLSSPEEILTLANVQHSLSFGLRDGSSML